MTKVFSICFLKKFQCLQKECHEFVWIRLNIIISDGMLQIIASKTTVLQKNATLFENSIESNFAYCLAKKNK